MTDFPVLTRPDLDETQRGLWDRITLGPRGFYCGGPNSTRIPDLYNAYLQFPELGQAVFDIAEGVRANSELSGRHRELMVLFTSIELGMRVEYDFHVPMARDQGISEAAIAAIGEGKTPVLDNDDDKAVYEANAQLLRTATISDDLRAKLIALFGHRGLMQLIGVTVLYVVTAYVTNVAKCKLADDFDVDQTKINDYYAGRAAEG